MCITGFIKIEMDKYGWPNVSKVAILKAASMYEGIETICASTESMSVCPVSWLIKPISYCLNKQVKGIEVIPPEVVLCSSWKFCCSTASFKALRHLLPPRKPKK